MKLRNVVVRVIGTVALLLAGLLLASTPASAEGANGFGPNQDTDFNGDGFADLAVAAPGESIGDNIRTGAVTILYGSTAGLTGVGSQLFHQNTPGVPGGNEFEDFWGVSMETGDFNKDGYSDLVIGAPTEDVGTIANAGAVTILYGSPTGLTVAGAQFFHQGTPGVPSLNEAGDEFGLSIAAGDLDGDGFDDLIVGSPFEDVGPLVNSGAITILRGSPAGITTVDAQLMHQGSAGVPGRAEAYDLFGYALATATLRDDPSVDYYQGDTLVVGAPGESIGSVQSAGAVTVFDFETGATDRLAVQRSSLIHQDTAGVPGKAESDDFFGAEIVIDDFTVSFMGMAIGSPGESIGSATGVGAVTIIDFHFWDFGVGPMLDVDCDVGFYSCPQMLTAGTYLAPPFDTQEGLFLGINLGSGDAYGDGYSALLIGLPRIDFSGLADAGMLFAERDVLYPGVNAPYAFASNAGFTESERGRFGIDFAVGDYDGDGQKRLVAGAFGAGGQGELTYFHGSPATALDQETPLVAGFGEDSDGWGTTLA